MDRLSKPVTPLIGFGGARVDAAGQIALDVTFGGAKGTVINKITFDDIDMQYPYNAILGRATLASFGAVVHHGYLCLKIPTEEGVITIRGDQACGRNTETSNNQGVRHVHNTEVENWPRISKAHFEGETKKVCISEARQLVLGTSLGSQVEQQVIDELDKNQDIFTWKPEDVKGIPRDIIEHELAVKPKAMSKKQKLRQMSIERKIATEEVVRKLLQSKVVHEARHTEWLANVILVKMANGK